jgi:hypothetical protein
MALERILNYIMGATLRLVSPPLPFPLSTEGKRREKRREIMRRNPVIYMLAVFEVICANFRRLLLTICSGKHKAAILVGRLSDGSWVYSHAFWYLPGTFALQYLRTQWLDQYDTLT